MFLLQVKKTAGSDVTNPITDGQVIHEQGLQVCYRLGNVCGFSHRTGNKLVMGEANVPVKSSDIDSIVQLLRNSSLPDKALGNDILNLAVIDFDQRSLTLANSITNSRPLLYWQNGDRIICSTSFKPMEACGVRLELNEQAIPEFMAYRQVMPPRTMYAGISRLIAGQVLTINLDDFKITADYRWQIEPAGKIMEKVTIGDHLDRIESILRTGMEKQIKQGTVSKILLSGGNDSSLLASLGKSIDPNVTSTSTSFSFLNDQDKEVSYATSAAKHIGIDHEVRSFTSEDYLRGVVESIHLNEEPIDHLQTALLYLIYDQQAGTNDVLFVNGLQADTIFGDQLQRSIYLQTGLLNIIRYTGMRPVIGLFCDLFNVEHPRLLQIAKDYAPMSRSDSHILWSILRYVNPKVVGQKLGFDYSSTLGTRIELLESYRHESILNQIMMASILYANDIQYWHKLAVKCGHRYSFPFIIPELIRYLFAVSWAEKLVEGKYLVRQLLSRNGFSNDFINRPKQSFGFPLKYWAVKGALFQPLVDMIEPEYPPGILASLQKEDYSRAMLLWNIINLYLFKKLMIEKVNKDELIGEILDRYRILNR